jgi:hypothetical protein
MQLMLLSESESISEVLTTLDLFSLTASQRAPRKIVPQNLFWGAARKIMRPIFLSCSNNPPKSGSENTFDWATFLFLATNEVSLGGK